MGSRLESPTRSERASSTMEQRRRRQAERMISVEKVLSRGPTGWRCSQKLVQNCVYSSVSSGRTKSRQVKSPKETALVEDWALPSGVRGPVEDWAFRRLAAIWASVAIEAPLINGASWYTRRLHITRAGRGVSGGVAVSY